MGIHRLLAERITSSSSGNMLRFLTLAAALALAAGMGMDEKKIMKDMMVFNSMTACWGKGNMYLYKLALLEATEQCTQQDHHNLLKPANPILSLLNQDAETLPFQLSNNQARNNNPFLSSSNSNNPFKSSSSQLNLNAWNNLWGNSRSKRQAEGLLQPNDMLETLYGTNDNYDWTQHNMPQNKYKRAALTLKIMYGTASDEEMAINDFFFGMDM